MNLKDDSIYAIAAFVAFLFCMIIYTLIKDSVLIKNTWIPEAFLIFTQTVPIIIYSSKENKK